MAVNNFSYVIDMEKTFEEYKEWTQNILDPNVVREYQRALKKLEKIQPFEESLVISLNSISYNFFNYMYNIIFNLDVFRRSSPSRIFVLLRLRGETG